EALPRIEPEGSTAFAWTTTITPGASRANTPALWSGRSRGFHVLTESATSAPSPLRGGLGRGWVWRSTEGPPPPTPPLKGEGSKKALIHLTVKGSRRLHVSRPSSAAARRSWWEN